MLNLDHYMDIKDLHRQGVSIRGISRMTGHSRNTVRKTLASKKPLVFQTPKRSSKLDAFKDYVKKRVDECNLSGVRLLEEIRSMGYEGGYSILKDYLRTIRPGRSSKLTVRFETPPGRQSQCDWGYCGQYADLDGNKHSIYTFVYVLSYSRYMFVRFTTCMHLKTLIQCHLEAFAYCGGWTETVLYDNMKQVRLDPRTWNPQFADFAAHYGISPRTHRPYRPRTKGKVERMVRYVKDNFLNGRCFAGVDELNAQARQWLARTANARVHATTGEVPAQLLKKEKLTPLESVPQYRWVDKAERVVTAEAMVLYERSHYSVPIVAAGQSVEVQARGQRVIIKLGDTVIAEHPRAQSCGERIETNDHAAERWESVLAEAAKGPPPGPKYFIGQSDTVQSRQLSIYEEAVQ